MRRVKDYFLPLLIGMYPHCGGPGRRPVPGAPLLKGQWLQTKGSRMFCLL